MSCHACCCYCDAVRQGRGNNAAATCRNNLLLYLENEMFFSLSHFNSFHFDCDAAHEVPHCNSSFRFGFWKDRVSLLQFYWCFAIKKPDIMCFLRLFSVLRWIKCMEDRS